MEFLNTSIIISTVHAAKGLEWDYVIPVSYTHLDVYKRQVLSPVVKGCNQLMETQTFDMNEYRAQKDRLEYEAPVSYTHLYPAAPTIHKDCRHIEKKSSSYNYVQRFLRSRVLLQHLSLIHIYGSEYISIAVCYRFRPRPCCDSSAPCEA